MFFGEIPHSWTGMLGRDARQGCWAGMLDRDAGQGCWAGMLSFSGTSQRPEV